MSKSRFFKHLSYTFSWGLHRPLSLSTFKACQYQSKPNSSLFSKMISSSSSIRSCTSLAASHDTSATTDSSAYLSVRIRCPKDVADMLSEALLCFGASSTSIDEQDDCESSHEIHIDSVFPQFQDVDVSLSQAADSIGLKEIPAYEVKMGKQCDWIRKTQDVRATNIILDPGLAFGTGEHPTTKLCLLLLRGLIKGGELFLDYGTGSGILAIAALKFGASLSVGLDVDPQAITSASHNAALNNIEPETMELRLVSKKTCSPLMDEGTNEVVKEQRTDGMVPVSETEKYDVVIANILLNPLLELADQIVSYAKPGAVVGLSGILSEQLPYIMDRYSVLLEDISVSEMDGWACASGKKKSSL
ncbi:ribosomal protein L11 methyltransferase isoform X2 [Manihot esculenta]|uniref:Uncharacterized protein n=1 Tax=Manihot esculenta TaxID=3983 RepID=A0ACB7GB72_MANES|nr:ribosomal protein L11 methyltransferase isoform X2 [Manihot esculenta]KAG8637161.1 hypothetical protein MANES_15G089200v8 [Manihot esculenta]